jgi:hypothetical protein
MKHKLVKKSMDDIYRSKSCYDRTYHVFEEGDEVYTDKSTWKSIRANVPYIVQRCYKPGGYVEGYPVVMIELVTDRGFKSPYASDRFLKTERQLREDKIKEVLNEG